MKPYPVQVEISGPTALWTRPDTGSSPVSYVAPTFSAVKGILESVVRYAPLHRENRVFEIENYELPTLVRRASSLTTTALLQVDWTFTRSFRISSPKASLPGGSFGKFRP